MHVLVLGIDQSALQPDSALARRIAQYATQVDQYTVIVPSNTAQRVDIAENAQVIGAHGVGKIAQLRAMEKAAHSVLRGGDVSVISTQDPFFVGLLGVSLGRRYGVGVEVQVHGWERLSVVRKVIARFVLPRATTVRTVSTRMAQQLVHEFGVTEDRVTSIPIVTVMPPSHEQKNYAQNKSFVVLSVGRLVPVKRFDLLIDAFAANRQAHWSLRIVGDGPQKQKLIQHAQKRGVADAVTFVGKLSHDDLQQEYQDADVFALTSDAEGWGMVVIEAAAHGLPILMTDVGCAGEVIRHEQEGFVVPVGDVGAIADGLTRLAASDSTRKRYGTAAQNRVSTLPGKRETIAHYVANWQKTQ